MLRFRGCRCRLIRGLAAVRQARATRLWARPTATHLAGTGADLVRTRGQLLAEDALRRQQPVVLRRSVTRPAVAPTERALLVLRVGRVRAWRPALLLVQPDTLLRWHRAGFRAPWRRKSRPGPGRPPLPAATVALIRRLAADNPRRGAERSCGALGKLGLRVAKRTIQTYLRGVTAPRPHGQTWAAFWRNHAQTSWAGAFLPVTDLACRPLFAFCISELATRRVVHVGATRHPTDAWVAQPLREATPFDQRPQYLIRDNDGTFGAAFVSVAAASGITILRPPHRAPRANATGARFLGSGRRACRDHPLVRGARHLARVLREYGAYGNRARPQQGLGHALPEPPADESGHRTGPIGAVPVLGGLHHTYHRAASGGPDALSAITGGHDRAAHQPQERVPARGHPQQRQHPPAALAAECEAEWRQHGQQTPRLAGVRSGQGGYALGEDRARAGGIVAPEAPNHEAHDDGDPLPGQIGEPTLVLALPPAGGDPAAGAGGRQCRQARFYYYGRVGRHQLLNRALGRGQRQDRGGSHAGLLAIISGTRSGGSRSMCQQPDRRKTTLLRANYHRQARSESAEEPINVIIDRRGTLWLTRSKPLPRQRPHRRTELTLIYEPRQPPGGRSPATRPSPEQRHHPLSARPHAPAGLPVRLYLTSTVDRVP